MDDGGVGFYTRNVGLAEEKGLGLEMEREEQLEPLSGVDAAWRHMEDPTNLMMVTGIMHLEGPLDREKLEQVYKNGWLIYDRMRQHIVDMGIRKSPHWAYDKPFKLSDHLFFEDLPQPAGVPELRQRINTLISTPLKMDRALWEVHVFENFESGPVLLLRIHHCIADGIALIGVLLSLTGETAEESLDLHLEPKTHKHYPQLSTAGYLFRQAGTALDTARKTTTTLINTTVKTLNKPSSLFNLAEMGRKGGASLARLLFKANDPKTIFKGPLGRSKVVAWSRIIPLEDVKRIRRHTGSTVNDVLLTALSGALNRYLKWKNEPTDGLEISAAVPVNLRSAEDAGELGNQFGLVFLTLPVGIDDPLDRLFELKKRMDRLKNTPEAIIALGMLKTLGMAPAELQKTIVNVLGAKITTVMTNVPGPRAKFFLAGKQVRDMMFWVPCSGRASMGISILSYAGEVRLGLATDEGLIPDPQEIIERFYEEFDALMDLVHMVEESPE